MLKPAGVACCDGCRHGHVPLTVLSALANPLPTCIGDELLFTHLRALSLFVKPEHLEIPNYFTNETQWGLAQKELHKINSYKVCNSDLTFTHMTSLQALFTQSCFHY